MKFGLSVACYRWICYPPTPHDNQGALIFNIGHPAFLNMGWPLPYTTSLRPPRPGQEWQWIIDKTAELGLSPLYLSTRWFADEEAAKRTREYAEAKGIALLGGGQADFVSDAGEWEHEKMNFVQQLRITRALGASAMAAVHTGALGHNHFSKDPPVIVQLRRMIQHFRELVPRAEEVGVVMAFENHMDYRCSEIAEVVAGVDSPWLRVNFDFANSYSVIEDPLDAARAVAEWTVMAHIKDMRVQPKTLTGEPQIRWAPLGRGTVPVGEILEVLAGKAPDPDNLPLCLEIAPLPDQDPDLWVKMSIEHMRSHFGEYLTHAR
ncbi:MAG: sugar phosphate isomerase/epimerase [Candidatus Latescibacteria bacterium]|nr:sugar phosphate isomerase/epimerase [Candidatus Latescibacterota bacterium]